MSDLALGFGLKFEDLYKHLGLLKLDQVFLQYLQSVNIELYNFLNTSRQANHLSAFDYSNFITELAPILDEFTAKLFNIEKEVFSLSAEHNKLSVIFRCKRLFVQRRAVKEYAIFAWSEYNAARIEKKLLKYFASSEFSELVFAENVMVWLEWSEEYKQQIDLAMKYAAWATLSIEGKARHGSGVLFQVARKLDYEYLIMLKEESCNGVNILKSPHVRLRDGFSLTDNGGSLVQVLDQAHFCIFCHNQSKDSCSKGFINTQAKQKIFKTNILGEQLTGCPLEEKISEMNNLKADGYSIGALATVIIDNPMVAATGHRICNDCMKSCIYQKQEPVNIPKVETRVLNDVLNLSWGFEIYSLFTRWNPLKIRDYICQKNTGYKVLVAGLGPAGFTLAHYLLNEGHIVVGIDGLKIEPLPAALSGVTIDNERISFLPIKDIEQFFEDLDSRIAYGFGGVAEYGITVRWNKNYLKIIRLLLERRQNFSMFGGVRFGSNINYDIAVKLGFDHIALALGAGRPSLIRIPKALASGVKMASDFLMALQLTGAACQDLITNLQVRLPILVIGGGLTAVDTATESVAYYVRQVEKFAKRYNFLSQQLGVDALTKEFTPYDWLVAQEFLAHAKLFTIERLQAQQNNRQPSFISIIDELGGVNVVYRKKICDAPSYRLNHEELEMALEEGIGFIENAVPYEVVVDQNDRVTGLKVKIKNLAEIQTISAHSIFVAAGTNPNTVLSREEPTLFHLDQKYFQAIDEEGNVVHLEKSCKPQSNHIFTTLDQEKRAISFFGDLHPSYAGNVVKAMASAKNGYKAITTILQKRQSKNQKAEEFFAELNQQFEARVMEVKQLTPTIIELIIKSPLAAECFLPGQFYRLQNYEVNALRATLNHMQVKLVMEGIALTGAWVDKTKGLISLIALEMGGSSDLCRFLQPGEKVVLMGPTGHPTEIKPKEQVLLVGGGLGNAVLFSIAKAIKEKGGRVLYFAGYKKAIDCYKIEEIERFSDEIVWCCDEEELRANRPQDKVYQGNIVNAILAYAKDELGPRKFNLAKIHRIIAIGSDKMMAVVSQARQSILYEYLARDCAAVASINSPMQCMMKEICAQCLSECIDPRTGITTYVYSCFNQDQNMDEVNFQHLSNRLQQNSLSEKLTKKLIDYSLRTLGKRTE